MRKLQILLPMLLLALNSIAQQKIVTGTVINKSTNEPLFGVTVQTKSNSTTTDSAGRFSIPVNIGETITLSYVGMNNQSFKISNTTQTLALAMEGYSDLNQVVVTGYKTEKKVDLTGAVSVVNLNDIKNTPASSPMLALQGQVPGLYIQTDGSPTGSVNGGPPTILIRGVNTLGNTNPLYVIDGVPTTKYEDFANLSASSIASLQVLKDASASSIYGSRASNGVIIVSTKDGSSVGEANKVHITLNTDLTFQTEKPWQESSLSSQGRGEAIWRAAVNDSINPNTTSLSNIYTYDWNNDYANPILNKVNIAPYVGGDSLEPAGNTNWQDALYKTATINSANLAISAGNNKSGLLIDLAYYNTNGLVVYTNFRRYSARINTHTSAFNGKFRIGENFQLSETSQVNSTTDVGGAPVADLALTLAPTIPVYKTDGTYGGPIGAGYSDRNNPIEMQYLNRWNTNTQLFAFGNIFAELTLLKNLVFRTSLGFDYTSGLAKTIHQIGTEGPIRSFNSLAQQQSEEFTFTWANTLNYNLTAGENKFNFLLGIESVHDDFTTFGATTTDFAQQNVNYFQLSSGSGSQTNNGSATGYRLLSQFGKINYSYSDRYLASVTVRRDGSSRFGTNNPYGIFPAFTLGWRINNEEFFRNVQNVSNLKLRFGVGTVGNQAIGNTAAYSILQANYGTSDPNFSQWRNTGTAYDIHGVNTGTLPSGYVQVQAANPNLKWESTTEYNYGVDFGFFHEKFIGSFDYYTRETSNILILPPVAAVVGEGQQEYVNGASISNKGWELALGYHNITQSGLGYSISASASHWHDIITYLPADVAAAYPGNAQNSIVGHSQFSYFGYKTQGLFQNAAEVAKHAVQPGAGPGRIIYQDLNGDGVINSADQTWLGTALPTLEYGLRLSFTYKNFDLLIFGSGVAGKTGFDPTKFYNSFVDTRNNYGTPVLGAWTPQNTGSSTPALSILNKNGEDRPSDFYYVNASYFKLRQVMFGYNFPKSITQKLKMESLRIYVSGQNLFAIKSSDFSSKDPERANSFANWPVPTSYSFGLNVNF
jgi:TonB-linked SusC/RagA family outer membrane protein